MYFHVSHTHPLPLVTAVVDVHVFPNVELRIDILKQILLGVHPSPVTPTLSIGVPLPPGNHGSTQHADPEKAN
jgi:hypothetical protein